MFAMVSMMRINAVEISKKSKCAKKLQFRKHWKCHTHSVRNVGNDDLNFDCYSWYGTNHGSRNFVKGKKCAKQTAVSKSFKCFKSDIHIVRHVGNDDLNYVCHG